MTTRARRTLPTAIVGILAFWSPFSVAAETELPRTLEREFEGAFVLTTVGDGRYDVFQRVDGPRGLGPQDEVVCLPPAECLVRIGEAPAGRLDEGSDLSALRSRFRAVRDAYTALETSDDADAAGRSWRDAIEALDACLASRDACR